jgi:hypothetical protein
MSLTEIIFRLFAWVRAAHIPLVADRRPGNPHPALLSLVLSSPFFFFPRAATSTGKRIRAPPPTRDTEAQSTIPKP